MGTPAHEACQATSSAPPPLAGGSEYHHYSAYGLHIASAVVLPQITPAAAGVADLTVALGAVEEGPRISRPGFRRGWVLDQFRYSIEEGRLIVIDPLPGASDPNVADLIMSRVLTAALYQRGLLPLHASAVATKGGIVVLSGPSGAGKSTLAGVLAARGGQVLADDMVVLGPDGGVCGHGAAGLKLSQPSLAKLGKTAAGLVLANSVESKYFLPATGRQGHDGRIATFVQLRQGDFAIEPMASIAALAGWKACIRMLDLLPEAPDQAALWRRWIELITGTRNLSVAHGGRMEALDKIADRLENLRQTEEPR